jgi:hypothetical protein
MVCLTRVNQIVMRHKPMISIAEHQPHSGTSGQGAVGFVMLVVDRCMPVLRNRISEPGTASAGDGDDAAAALILICGCFCCLVHWQTW